MTSPLRCLIIPGILIFINLPSTYQQEVFQLTMKNITAAPGGNYNFDVQVVTGVTGDGEWSKDGTPLSPVHGKLMITVTGQYRQLFVFDLAASDGGRYTYTIQGRSTSAYLTVAGASGPVDGNWGEWTQWSSPSCPATCGPTARGPVYRSRTCTNPAPSSGGASCPGQSSQSDTQECGPTTCATAVNGNWGQWTQWSGSTCPATCGSTARRSLSRSRTCTDPAPSNGGASCPGQSSQSETRECGPATCVTSIFARQLLDVTRFVGGQVLFQVDLTQSGVTGVWTKDGVTITADARHQLVPSGNSQILYITGLQVSDSGQYSFTANGETTSAQLTVQGSNTPVNGNWGQWTQWSGPSCPATCGSTARRSLFRSRTCTNPAPSNGGASCPGQSSQTDTQECGPTTCATAVNGNWGQWTQWSGSTCPATCGPTARGPVSRSRTCTDPAPSNGGASCPGQSSQSESRECGPATCVTSIFARQLLNVTRSVGGQVIFQVDLTQSGVTGVWTKDGVTITADAKHQLVPSGNAQILYISGLQVSDSGQYSFTANGETTSAQLTVQGSNTPVNGNWGQWTQWSGSTCPATCGPTARRPVSRFRTCTNPAPSNGGASCPGQSSQSETQECGPTTCGTIESGLRNISVPVGQAVVLQVIVTQPGLAGAWQRDGVRITGGSRYQITSPGKNHIFLISNAQVSDSGRYTLTVNGDVTSAWLTVSGATNGNWGAWTQWSSPPCPATCGPTARHNVTRTRSCDNPAPSNGGAPCSGQPGQINEVECGPVNCGSSIFTSKLENATRREGLQMLFQVALTQTGLTGVWQKDDGAITDPRIQTSNVGNSYLYIQSVQVSDSGKYSFKVRGETTTAWLTVTTVSGATNGNWGAWTQWSSPPCPAMCGPTARHNVTRTRSCDNPAPSNGGTPCSGQPGQSNEVECGPSTCVDGGVSEWSSWSNPSCPATCGRAVFHTQIRSRTCNSGSTCTQSLEETRTVICMDSFCPVDGGFTQWSMWTTTTPCTETCGPDVMKTLIRTRTCTNPAPSFGGSDCVGDTQQTSQENCNLPVCGAIQSQLQSQSAVPGGAVVFEAALSQDNAVGYWQKNGNTLTNSSKTRIESIGRTQRLTISNVQASDVGNYSFVVNGETTTAALTLRSTTPVDGGFSEWGMWTSGQCSVTCGDGMTTDTRRRTCTSPLPQNGGQPCSGPTSETRTTPCTMTCTVNGGYTLWSDWVRGSCSGSCDGGTQTDTRTRSCTNPRPQNGGLQCSGPSSETRTISCIMPGCEVDGGETEWGSWVNRSCSVTCGKGATRTTDRHRNCTNPEPKNRGRACVLHLYESKVVNCGLGDCPSTGKSSSFTLERDGLYIGLIAAIIAIGVCLIIIIVACCLWNCRKEPLPKKNDHLPKPITRQIR
ncbi:SCO-spondin-like [Haliotis rufescens]|uniref:SCO-spondin-like n=1 Tax=Haliotis rufescens TaxID=6454 RepID=UPI00201F661A|nr:SCO-spondin-like [Haliotis rufescens]